MELYEIWKNRAEQHDYEAHQLRQWKYIEDPSCYICHPWRNEDHIGDELEKQFLIFWEYYQPMFMLRYILGKPYKILEVYY